MSTAPQTFFPRIDPSIPRDIQRHLQLIYSTLNNHAMAFQALPKSTNSTPAPVTGQTFFPRIASTIPHEVQEHLTLIYRAINNHYLAFAQLPKLNLPRTPKASASSIQTFDAHIEPTIPHDVQLHLQLIYQKLNNHTQAFAFYTANSPAA